LVLLSAEPLDGTVTETSKGVGEEQLHNWKLIERFRSRLLPLLEKTQPLMTEKDPRRQLTQEVYFSLFLFRMLNPVLTSMRGLCAATTLRKTRSFCPEQISIGSFSEGQHLFAPDILEKIVRQLAQEAKGMAQFGDRQVREAVTALTIVDGTVFRAVQRMAMPAAGPGYAVRLNVHFSAFDQVPEDWSITAGKTSELKEWKRMAKVKAFYVGDRIYSEDFLFLKQAQKRGTDFVVRLIGRFIRIPQGQARPLTDEDRQAGVLSDQMVELGGQGGGPVVRLVEIHADGKVFLLITTRQDLPAHTIGLIYRYRWQIELFFKWVKTMLPCRHWLAESPEGIAIQLYSVLIAALLLFLASGRRPNKRQMEALWFYFNGLAEEDELLLLLKKNH
jgi:hypothetical protein